MKRSVLLAAPLFLVLAAAPHAAQSQRNETVTVYAAAAVKTSLTEIANEFERATGNSVSVVFDSAGWTLQHFLDDPEAELLIATRSRDRSRESSSSQPLLAMARRRYFACSAGAHRTTPEP